MFTRSKTSLGALLCAIALLASACGGSSSATATEVVSTDDSSQADDAGTTSDSESSSSSEPDEVVESPLADLIGIPFNDDAAAEEYFTELGRQAEISVAECMLRQGFEYQVIDYSQFDTFDANVDFESREFAEESGFGIASNPFEESFEAFESFEDPNEEYLESLTEGEREAYDMALIGELPEPGADFQNFEPGGCQGEAFEDTFAFVQVFEQFGSQFEEIEEAYNADPRIVGASTGWGTCMSEAGFSFSDQESAEDDIRRRYDAIVSSSDAFADEPPPADLEDLEDGEEFFFGPQLNAEAQAEVDALAVEEQAIAVASWDCNEPLREIEDDVRIEYEQRFVDENGAAITEALGG